MFNKLVNDISRQSLGDHCLDKLGLLDSRRGIGQRLGREASYELVVLSEGSAHHKLVKVPNGVG